VVADEPQPVSITPHLAVSNHEQISDDDIDALTDRLVSGERITVATKAASADILGRVGLSAHEVTDRMRHAGL